MNVRKQCEILDQLQKHLRETTKTVNPQLLADLLLSQQKTLQTGAIEARRSVQQKTITGIELGRDRGRLHYRFPLYRVWLERVRGLEPLTSTLGRLRSTTELYPHCGPIIKPGQNNVKLNRVLQNFTNYSTHPLCRCAGHKPSPPTMLNSNPAAITHQPQPNATGWL